MLATDKFTSEQMEFISPADGYYTYEDNFDNLVTGYEDGKYLLAGTNNGLSTKQGYVTTDFILVDSSVPRTYRIGGDGITWSKTDTYARIAWYDANKSQIGDTMPATNIEANQGSDYYPDWVEDENVAAAFVTKATMSANARGAVYFKVTAKGKGENLKVTVDEEQSYTAVWHGEPKRLDDSIYAQNVILKSPSGKVFKLTIDDSGNITPTEFTE
jgi:hypothetical protein